MVQCTTRFDLCGTHENQNFNKLNERFQWFLYISKWCLIYCYIHKLHTEWWKSDITDVVGAHCIKPKCIASIQGILSITKKMLSPPTQIKHDCNQQSTVFGLLEQSQKQLYCQWVTHSNQNLTVWESQLYVSPWRELWLGDSRALSHTKFNGNVFVLVTWCWCPNRRRRKEYKMLHIYKRKE